MRVISLPQANCEVKGISLELLLWYVRGLEFTMFSASLTIVTNSSNVSSFLEMADAKLALIGQVFLDFGILLHLEEKGFPQDKCTVVVR